MSPLGRASRPETKRARAQRVPVGHHGQAREHRRLPPGGLHAAGAAGFLSARAFFYQQCTAGREGKVPLKVIELPYYVALGTLITQEFIDKEKARLGNLFAQEYECAFISSGTAAIEPELLERGMAGDFELDPLL